MPGIIFNEPIYTWDTGKISKKVIGPEWPNFTIQTLHNFAEKGLQNSDQLAFFYCQILPLYCVSSPLNL